MISSISSRMESLPNLDPTTSMGGMGGAGGIGGASFGQSDPNGQRRQQAHHGQVQSVVDSLNLSPESQQQLVKLQQRDREVRTHEQAHIAAGGPHITGGASYHYTRGPDGQQYATGGSVSIDTSPVSGDPEATEEKARTVRRAALAPGSPSAQDQSIAAQAANMEMKARMEKAAAAYQPMQDAPGMNLAPQGARLALAV